MRETPAQEVLTTETLNIDKYWMKYLAAMTVLFWLHIIMAVGIMANSDYNYSENVNILRNFPSNQSYLLTFDFNQTLRLNASRTQKDWSHFPRIVGEMLTVFNISDLKLVSSAGKAFHAAGGDMAKSSGVQLTVRLDSDSSLGVTKMHDVARSLVSDISGVFCFGISFITLCDDNTCVSHHFEDFGFNTNSHQGICTENLSPWMKLLPCRNNGLITLIKAYTFFSSDSYELVLSGQRYCEGDGDSYRCNFELKQSLGYIVSYHSNGELSPDIIHAKALSKECTLASYDLDGTVGSTVYGKYLRHFYWDNKHTS